MAQDAIALLKADHTELKELFDQFEQLTPRALKRAGQIRDRIVKALSVHASIEERVFYPITIDLLPELEETVLEGMEEHAMAEQLLAQVAVLSAEDRWFRPKMMVLMESVRLHIKEEERDLFTAIRKSLSKDQLIELGEALREERKTAPTVPPAAAQVRGLLEDVTERARAFLNRAHAVA